ncbi:hypothetical protein BGZ63DRAFT_406884 [Mariannaea sp. PMI_226]|nr:hypothetical protein BGZ63DRAFT_406884 [Mariannaea sp. PMI_226]
MSSHGMPEVLMKKVDEYVDSLAPQIQPRITSELEIFQQKTIETLETQVVEAFRSLFDKDSRKSTGGGSRGLDDAAPDSYGGKSLPFADEIAKLSRSFSQISDEAGDDLRDIFDLTEGRNDPGETRSRGGGGLGESTQGARGFLSAAINVVQDHLDDNNRKSERGGQRFELDGLLGVISNTVKDAARNPEDTARLISPEIKEKVGDVLQQQHAPIAEQFTRIALDHIKHWLRGNTSTRDLGDGVKGELEDQVKDLVKGIGGLFGHSHKRHGSETSSRGLSDRGPDTPGGGEQHSGTGFSKLISDKLSTGLARVHRDVRLEFRKILGKIEKELFELLPDKFQRPLEKILGGNPFDSQLDRDIGSSQSDRGFGDDIKVKLVNKIRDLIRKVQETLRVGIMGVVNGGHRKFESQSWVFVHNMVELKVQKYLPKVKITVPDDIGNEGVSVGTPAPSANLGGSGGGSQAVPSSQGGYDTHNSHQQSGGHSQAGQAYPPPPKYENQQDYRPDHHQQNQEYRPPQQEYQHGQYPPPPPPQQQSHQEYRPDQYQPAQHQSYQDYKPSDYQPPQNQSYQEYRPDQYQSSQQYQSGQNQGYQQSQRYEANPPY